MRLLCLGVIQLVGLLAVLGADALPLDTPEDRLWEYQGTTLRARLVEIDQLAVKVVMSSDGWSTKFWLDQLSEPDRKYVEKWKERGFGTRPEPKAEKPILDWPGELAPNFDFEARLVSSGGGQWIYETPNYQYRSDVKLAPSLIKEYAINFEGTYYAIQHLPLQLKTEPPNQKFVVRMFRDPNDYFRAGGLKGSSGTYVTQTKEILVPLSSLGIKLWGEQIALDRRTFDRAPLVHEITHQVMHYWVQVLPVWFVEGMAEYMAAVPFNGEWYDFANIDEGIRQHLERAYSAEATRGQVYKVDMVPPRELMAIGHEAWAEALRQGEARVNYASAMLMVYFFAHLDDESGISPLVDYLKRTKQGRDSREKFVAEYNEAVQSYIAAKAKFNQQVEDFNAALLKYRKEAPAFNEKVRSYNQQVARGVPPGERIDVGLPPKLPERPVPPPKPAILTENPEAGDVDLSEAEIEARSSLFKGRDPDDLWAAIEEAFAEERIWVRLVSSRS